MINDMAKSEKIEFSNADIIKKDNRIIAISKDVADETITTEYDLNKTLDKFIDKKNVKFSMKVSKPRNGSPRPKIYKYRCPNCGKEIKSKDEELQVECLDCGQTFEKVD